MIYNSEKAPAPVGPYNQAVSAGGILFGSGQIPIDPETNELLNGSIEEETHQVLKNIGAVLEAAGLNYSDIIKCSIFVSDINLYGRINAIYAEYFEEASAPARELVEVSNLPKFARVEISFIAALK